MYKIISPVKGFTKSPHYGLVFASGVSQTDDVDLARRLEKKGYTVEEIVSKEPEIASGEQIVDQVEKEEVEKEEKETTKPATRGKK